MFELHALVPDDWRQWRDLRLQALADAPAAFGSTLAAWQDAGEDRWRQRLAIPGSHNLLAVLDGEPVGMASGVPTDDGAVELISMWVAPRGRGRGIGGALVAEVERWARSRGATLIRLDVVEGNEAAIGLYLRSGFRFSGDVSSEGSRTELTMVKVLRPGDAA